MKKRHQQHRVLSKKLQNHHLPIKRTDDNKQLQIMEMVKCNKLTIFIMEGKSKKNQQQRKAFFFCALNTFSTFWVTKIFFTLNDQPIAPH